MDDLTQMGGASVNSVQVRSRHHTCDEKTFSFGVGGKSPMLNLLSGVYFSIANNGWIIRLARTGLLNATSEQSELNG